MALILANLAPSNPSVAAVSRAAGALRGAPRMWTYMTEDTQTDVDTSGYFNAGVAYRGAHDMLEVGDLIYIVTMAAGALSQAGFFIVRAKTSGTVDLTNATVLTTTNSD